VSDVEIDPRLYRDWWAVAVGLLVVAGVVVLRATAEFGVTAGIRWSVVAVAVGLAELGYLRRHLRRNHPEGTPAHPYSRLGIANGVTVVRGTCFAALAGFAVVRPDPAIVWVPAACYGVGVTLDLVDGAIARGLGRTTVLGEKLDMAFDTLGFLVAIVVAVAWGRLPVWYLSLALARYVFKFAVAVRERRGLPVRELPPSRLRRYLAALQMAFITVALAPFLSATTVYAVAPVVLLPSLVFFARDYLVVTGRVSAPTG
jgi:CDP-diacylglycerol--glycerol-3-phosphate 3-phosphatidyltransferase